MTVIELIRALRKVENKGQEVYIQNGTRRLCLELNNISDENGTRMFNDDFKL